jgi:hypothetical protein
MSTRQPAAFLSYARKDDELGERITAFRDRLTREVGALLGEDFEIFRDTEDIVTGEKWEDRVERGIRSADLLIAIVTPRFLKSPHCRREVELFVAHEKQLQREGLILPIYFIHADDELQDTSDGLVVELMSRHLSDWREYRMDSWSPGQVSREFTRLALQIKSKLASAHAPARVSAPPAPARQQVQPAPPRAAAPVARPPAAEPTAESALEAVRRACGSLPETFATRDLSEDPSLQGVLTASASPGQSVHAWMGSFLSRHRETLGLFLVASGGPRGATWRQTGQRAGSPLPGKSAEDSTVSNPHYTYDLHQIDFIWDQSKVITPFTILLLVGTHPFAELIDRSIAEVLRDDINRQGDIQRGQRAIVLTDVAWNRSPALKRLPTIALGGPTSNTVTAEIRERGTRVPESTDRALWYEAGDRTALWGDGGVDVQTAVKLFIDSPRGLKQFLSQAWK